MSTIHTAICETPLSIEQAMDFVNRPENGATNLFIGRVRNHNLGRPVDAVSYDVFAPLACKVMDEICHEAQKTFGTDLALFIEHFKGKLEIGGISVVIAVGCAHRDTSFKACRYLIEQLKIRVPVWKLEHYTDGDSDWVPGHSLQEPANG